MTGTTKPRTIDDLCRVASQVCHCPADRILTRDRSGAVAQARQFLYCYLSWYLGLRLAETGRVVGTRDHSTVSYGITRMDGYLVTGHRAIVNRWAAFLALTAGWELEAWDFPALTQSTHTTERTTS